MESSCAFALALSDGLVDPNVARTATVAAARRYTRIERRIIIPGGGQGCLSGALLGPPRAQAHLTPDRVDEF